MRRAHLSRDNTGKRQVFGAQRSMVPTKGVGGASRGASHAFQKGALVQRLIGILSHLKCLLDVIKPASKVSGAYGGTYLDIFLLLNPDHPVESASTA